jgi:inosine triphosphate pyrophosphatase
VLINRQHPQKLTLYIPPTLFDDRKWFLESCGHVGLNKMLDGFDDRTAYAQCIFAFTTSPDVEPIIFEGRTHGSVVTARAGTGPLFGWDPIFEPCAADQAAGVAAPQTYAEMDKDHKNKISHRYRSLDALRTHILEHFDLSK